MRACLLLLAVTLGGCVWTQPLPDAWPDVSSAEGATCDWINGVYYDKGESGTSNKPSLSRMLDWSEEKASPETLSITYVSGASLVVVGGSDASSFSHVPPSSQFSCVDGTLRISRSVGINREGVLGYENVTHLLYPANGFLIVKSTTSGVGIVLLIPVVGSYTYYYRFARATP